MAPRRGTPADPSGGVPRWPTAVSGGWASTAPSTPTQPCPLYINARMIARRSRLRTWHVTPVAWPAPTRPPHPGWPPPAFRPGPPVRRRRARRLVLRHRLVRGGHRFRQRRTTPTPTPCWRPPARWPPGYPGRRCCPHRRRGRHRTALLVRRRRLRPDAWNAGFSELEPYRGANSNMHSVEAYLAAGDVTGNPVWHDRAVSIATRLIDEHARAHAWRIPEHYDENWHPLPDYNLRSPRRPVPAVRHHTRATPSNGPGSCWT